MTRIGVVLGSTRPGRRGDQVARWVIDQARRRSDAEFELVDLAEVIAWSEALAPLREVVRAA